MESIIGHSEVFMKNKGIKFSNGKYISHLHHQLKPHQFNFILIAFCKKRKGEIEDVEITRKIQ